jgi:hypothetical protein
VKGTTIHIKPELHKRVKEDAKRRRMLLAGRAEELIVKGFQYEKILSGTEQAMIAQG